jgi:hypothetical protein
MNERIKELRSQVKMNTPKFDPVFYEKHVAPLTNAFSKGGNEVVDEFLEKFAELIAKECLKLCKEAEDDLADIYKGDELDATRIGARYCYESILDNFGVEE